MEPRSCVYCKTSFLPNKYAPRQKVCGSPDCQRKRQLDSMRLWRQNHPDYFKFSESKGTEWLENQRQRSKLWRQQNPEKVRAYRQRHIDEYRSYMREYMRRHRQKLKGGATEPASPDKPPQP